MKKSRSSDEQIVRILREADQMPVTQVAKKNCVSEATIYTCRNRFGEMEVNDVRHLKQLEQENGRLKKLLAERDLEIEVMKEVSRKKW
jgi:putative transposase